MPGAGRVAVIGGGGFYGGHLVDDLLQRTAVEVIVVSRTPRTRSAWSSRVTLTRADFADQRALRGAVAGCAVVVHCAGPFRAPSMGPLAAAMDVGAAYVDIAEGREHIAAVRALDGELRARGLAALPGASVVPGLEALAAEAMRPGLDRLVSFRALAAPDTRRHRGRAMFETMLGGVGAEFDLPREGRPRRVRGWTEPEWVDLPPPVGPRLTHLVLEMADADVLVEAFGFETVEFKAGTEFPIVNRLLNTAARIRVRTGHPRWERWTASIRAVSWLVGRIGREEGGVVFELVGSAGAGRVHRELAIVDGRNGGRIPSVLAGIAVEELLAGRVVGAGVLPYQSWIAPDRLVTLLRSRGLDVFAREGTHPWERVAAALRWP